MVGAEHRLNCVGVVGVDALADGCPKGTANVESPVPRCGDLFIHM